LKEIVLSTLHVTWLALHPSMKEKIDPRMVNFKTRLKSDVARVTLANSITLTPGTITVRVEGDVFTVHALSDKVASGLPGEMEDRIARIFTEERA
jgi:multicomponent Na+:H+ antiporter subunit E